ncbi:MAG: hypothetical protein ACO4CG_16360, partial [Prochlorothrix sp.]
PPPPPNPMSRLAELIEMPRPISRPAKPRLTMRWSRITTVLQTSLGLLLLGFALAIVVPELASYGRSGLWQGVDWPTWDGWAGAIAATLLSYGAIACYDLLAFRYLDYAFDRRKICFTGLLTYSLSPSLGLPFLSAGAIRYRFYGSWGIPPVTIAQIIVFSNATLWVGLCGVAGLSFWLHPLPLPPRVALPMTVGDLGRLGLAIVGLYLGLCAWSDRIRVDRMRVDRVQDDRKRVRRATTPWTKAHWATTPWTTSKWAHSPWTHINRASIDRLLPSFPVASGQLLTFALDWGGAALALYLLLEVPSALSFSAFFGIYALAMVIGLLSTVPGGLGVLETVMLFF